MRYSHENDYDDIINQARVSVIGMGLPDVDRPIVKAVIATESAFSERAIRQEPQINDASRGLMQLLLKTAQAQGFARDPADLFIPSINILYGVKLLATLRRQLPDWESVFSGYNGGVRPDLGFGVRAQRTVTVCLARDTSGKCIRQRLVPPGEFANQDYVNTVMANLGYFSDVASGGSAGGETGIKALGVLGLVAVGTLIALARR